MIKTKKLIIFGNSNYAEMVCDYFEDYSEYEVVAFTIDSAYRKEDIFYNKKIVDFDSLEKDYPPEECDLFVAVGSSNLNYIRAEIFSRAIDKGYNLPSFIHPSAYIGPKVSIGKNCILMECCKVLSRTNIGDNVIVWPTGFISHNCVVKDNAYIVGGANGFSEIGENCFLGAGAMIADNVIIAKDNFITMSAVVRKNTDENSIYEGIPAKKREKVTALAFSKFLSSKR